MKTLCEEEIGIDVDVKGFRVLLKAVVLPEKRPSGLLFPEQYRKTAPRGYNIAKVIKMGPLAFTPLSKFGDEPFCKVGDWVAFSHYELHEVKFNDYLCWFINDERILATIPDELINVAISDLR